MFEPQLADILERELAQMRARRGYEGLDTLETGVIRPAGPARHSDGHSTLTFTTHADTHAGTHTGVDLDTAHAQNVLGGEVMAGVIDLIQADSVKTLEFLAHEGRAFDLILLDAGDDPHQTFREYLVALELVRHPGLIVINDVNTPSAGPTAKGDVLLPYLEDQGHQVRMDRRWGAQGWIDVVLVDFVPDPVEA